MTRSAAGPLATVRRVAGGLLLAGAIALLAPLGGCAKKQNVSFDDEALKSRMAAAGVDQLALADFARVDALIKQGEDRSAQTLLANMPAKFRETPAWHFRKATLHTRAGDYAKGKEAILKAQIGIAYPREFAYLAAWLELADANIARAAEILLDIVDRDGRDRLAWMYLLHAVAEWPNHPGISQAILHLKEKYPRAPELRAMEAALYFASGQTETGVERMKELVKARPNDFAIRRLYIDFLRNMADYRSTGREIKTLLDTLPAEHPERPALETELESILFAASQREKDPVPGAIAFNSVSDSYEEMVAQVPRNVPLSERDPRDGMPRDAMGPDGKPVYYLPFRANNIVAVGERRDRIAMFRMPKMENPERDNRTRNAYDFLLPEGSPIVAARGGVVRRVAAHAVLDTGAEFDRVIEIAHRDGTIARYWHIQFNRASVQPGDTVYRGQPIGATGRAALTAHQHLRFEVVVPAESDYDWWEPYTAYTTLPVVFADVSEPDGVPVEGRWYRSRNVWVPPIY